MSALAAELFAELLVDFQATLNTLPDKPEETAAVTLHALWVKAQGKILSAKAAQTQTLAALTEEQVAQLKTWMALRLIGVPLAHILERQSFMGLELKSTPAALIPRSETEILARLALDCLTRRIDAANPKVIDVCTGSGNIALTLAHYYPQASIFASDLSVDAIKLANENSELLRLNNSVSFRSGDLLEPFKTDEFLNQTDLLICNPPYILATNVNKMPKEISAHEPSMAFDGGPLGIAIIDRTIRDAVTFLKLGGWLCLEIGAGQGPFVEKRLLKSGHYTSIETATDEHGQVRAIACQKPFQNMSEK